MGVGMAHETHFTTHPLPREDRVPCPNCRGEGQIAFMTGSSPPQECTLCQGTGVKPAIKAFVVKGKVTVNAYAVITRAVEEGVRYGWMRAHKHVDKPDEHQMCQEMENGVMNALCEVLNWGDEDEEA
jgi:DnaJ-class molecular chaperone